MEVGALGQGGQASLNTNKSVDNIVSADSKKIIEGNTETDSVNKKDLNKAISKLNKFLEDNKTHAEYEMHDKFKDIIIKIIDDKTGKVIQELPPKKILDMIAKMCELVGVLFDKKA